METSCVGVGPARFGTCGGLIVFIRYRCASIVLFIALTPTVSASGSFSFDDIEFWVGEGFNEAALVIDFNDGIEPVSLAWGYRFNGETTGEDMILDIVHADPLLYGKVTEPGEFGISVFGLGYDLDADGFALDDGTVFEDGLFVGPPADGTMSLDPDDHYREGWFTDGFWGYYLGIDPYDGGSWESAMSGPSDRVLSDGDWDGWSWQPNFEGTPPDEPVPAVPAPAALWLMVGLEFVRRRRGR
jgi:hypothetical protein